MTTHNLKIWPEFFDVVRLQRKPFDVRKNDRDFKVNDLLVLEEWDPATKAYTGRPAILRIVTYIMNKPEFVLPGTVILGLRPLLVPEL